ncbi:DUF58 domain-containing protein [Uliginosibacterium sp. TH139]|uniref:DUF58 domain-containing protein n=1 Tax=Uliginosibacterium sp. TH139 TaxID=2067453 RepID=UPI000C7D6B37|nr:DUF58 domain-containing protein [Uliginosibacterium sp. TH139]PLK47251.1 DUF58 domain-containing protein [Uliginosibacterium sp. TH139]
MMLPAKALLAALAAWLVLAIASAIEPALQPLDNAAGVALLLWAAVDWLRARSEALPAAQRVVNATLAVGEWAQVELRFHWAHRVPAELSVFDHHPSSFQQEGLPAAVRTAGNNAQALRYRVRPRARGDHAFGRIELRIRSPWAAWLRQVQVAEAQEVRVYPNFAPLTRHALRAVDYRNARFGLQQRQRRGQGMDFSQLREYREGDSMRQIDWKATTRMGKMISREYQDERDQRILLLVDCGRRMGARENESAQTSGSDLSHFDHALDTVLMLAYVALSHGDRVGLMTLGGPERYLPVQHSAATVSRILRETYDLQPTLQVSDFERAAQQLLLRERKRALVVLMTNLRDEDDQGLLAAARLLSSRHLVLVASLREAALDAAQDEGIQDAFDAARVTAAVDYARRREATLRRLRAEGVLCLDVKPEDLAIETVNRYLAVKAANRL